MLYLKLLLCAGVSYLLGSLSFSIIYSKIALGGDVRKSGSGNAGATNMARVYGLRYGLATLGCDMLKASAAMLLGHFLAGDLGFAVASGFAMIGHCFPVFYNFKGGKGIAVGAAIALGMNWHIFVFGWVIFLSVLFLSKRVSVGSLVIAVWIAAGAFIYGLSLPVKVLAIFMMVFVIWRHKENIKRLLNGTEPEFRPKK